MAANINPIFSLIASIIGSIWTSSLTANTRSDGVGTIGTDMVKAFTADATNGSFVDRLRFTPSASVAATATTATVLRVYLSTIASGATTRTDTFLFAEIACPSQTVDQTTIATTYIEVPFGFALPPSMTILWSMHHAANANTSWQCTPIAGNY
jgi:hypothetical protein